MTLGRIVGMVLVGSVAAVGGAARAGQQISPGCEKIVAVLDQSGGALSADEVAKRTGTDVETVRSCTDQWRATMKDKGAPTGAKTAPPMPPGCEKIVGVLDQSGDALSADEVAKRTSTDVQTVRSCTDAWRRTMKRGATP